MPMGWPLYKPEPKSACKCRVGPIVFTKVTEFAATGILSMGMFQMLFAGKTLQFPMAGWADKALASKTRSGTTRQIVKGRLLSINIKAFTYRLNWCFPRCDLIYGAPRRLRNTNGDIWARLTGSYTQYCVALQPVQNPI